MASYTTTTTFDTTGVGARVITPGFQTIALSVDVAPRVGSAFQGIQFCSGWTDITRKKVGSVFFNPATGNAISENYTDKIVKLWGEDGSGNLTVLVEATVGVVSSTQVKFDITKASADYQVSIKCES